MIVRFDLECSDPAIADIDNAGVFARALHDEFSTRRQALQVDFAGFVGAVLAPHHAENSQLGDIGIAAEDLLNAAAYSSLVTSISLSGDFGSGLEFPY